MNTDNYAVTLESWWENAEQGTPREGDRLMINEGDGDYAFERAAPGVHEEIDTIRILLRAAPPRPAWTDAVAVMADAADGITPARRTFTRQANGLWKEDDRQLYTADVLVNVTPLVEQRVTNEMVKRAAQSLEDAGWDTSDGDVPLMDALHAALGIDPA